MKFEVVRVGGGYAVKPAGRPYYGSDEHSVFPTRREAKRHAKRREIAESEPQHDAELHEALNTTPGRRTARQVEIVEQARRSYPNS